MKVLLLDTAFASVPIYNALLAAGHEVWVMGNRSTDILAQLAQDHWIEQDYSDVKTVETYLRRGNFSRVIPGCTDVSIATCARMSLMKGYIDPSNINDVISDKARFREACKRTRMRAPRVIPLESLPAEGRMICKPVDSFSGRGVSVFELSEAGALDRALASARTASPSGRAIIETFIQGQLHSCTGFLESGRLVDTAYVIEGSAANAFAVDTSYVTNDVPEVFRCELENSLEALAADLMLVDGLIHTQFILAADGAYVVEVSRRCPGDLYSTLIELATGYPYAARYASFFLGERIAASTGSRRHILRHTITSGSKGIYPGIIFNRPIQAQSFFPIKSIGQKIASPQDRRAGILFCEVNNDSELSALYSEFINQKVYNQPEIT